MLPDLIAKHDAIADLCRIHGVRRLTLFGSASTTSFDATQSDIDLIAEFDPESPDRFNAYFDLKEDLEALLGHPVDLITPSALDNPYLARAVDRTRHELYAA